jgi:transcriptional regulator with XRE-family HTH domain
LKCAAALTDPENLEMEMKLNATRLRELREGRAWSQEHLAAIAGLSARTIQRIESTGAAAYETALALAASLEVDLTELRVQALPPKSRPTGWLRGLRWSAAMGAMIGMVVLGNAAWANQIMLNVASTLNGTVRMPIQMITKEGRSASMILDDKIKVVIVPTTNAHGEVVLSTQLYEFDGKTFQLRGRPKLVTGDGTAAVIRTSTEGGTEIELSIVPHIVSK